MTVPKALLHSSNNKGARVSRNVTIVQREVGGGVSSDVFCIYINLPNQILAKIPLKKSP